MDSPVSSLLYPIQMTKKNGKRNKARVNKLGKQMAKVAIAPQIQQKEASLGRNILRLLGGAGGGIGGFITGGPAGAMAAAKRGYSMGNTAATVLGLGKYSLRQNSLARQANATGVPFMHSNSEMTVVRHREYLGDINSSTTAGAFSIGSYPLNPGQSSTFPWLSTVASNYQEYTFKGLLFEFRSTSADAIANAVNTALGSVMMGTIYNPALPPFTNKIQMLNEYYSTDGKPSENICHFVECDPKENPFNILYIRPGAVPPAGNIQNFDLGTFSIATVGFQGANVNCGELWVSYEVELRKPTPVGISGQNNSSYVAFGAAGVTTSAYFGTSQVVTSDWFDGTVTLTGTTITINSSYTGPFLVTYNCNVTGSSTPPSIAATSNCTAYNVFNNGAYNDYVSGTVATGGIVSTYAFQYVANTVNPNIIVLTLSGATIVGGTNANLLISPLALSLS